MTDGSAAFLRRMRAAPEWDDLELLLQTARGLGLRLRVDQPINGLLGDAQGVTASARQAYYRQVAEAADLSYPARVDAVEPIVCDHGVVKQLRAPEQNRPISRL